MVYNNAFVIVFVIELLNLLSDVAICGRIYLVNKVAGTIESPRFPKVYPDDLNITWELKVNNGYKISFYFTEFGLEDSYEEGKGSCVYDYIKITESGKVIHQFCGTPGDFPFDAPKIGRTYSSNRNSLTIQFVSDYSNEDITLKGFKMHYKEEDIDECYLMRQELANAFDDWDLLVYCNHHCVNIPGSFHCKCDRGFTLDENKHTCKSDCSGILLREKTGTIQSSRYPKAYSKLASCDWTIEGKEGIDFISIRFVGKFDIEDHVEEGCVYDWLQYEVEENNISEKYCGNSAPNDGKWIHTNSHRVVIRFHSDLSVEKTGFQIEYSMSPGPVSPDGVRRCPSPNHLTGIKHSRIMDDLTHSLAYNSTVTVACNQWYEMTSGTAVWKCGADGEWLEASVPVKENKNNNAPDCRPICGLKGTERIRATNYSKDDVIPNEPEKESLLVSQVIGGRDAKDGEWPWMAFVDRLGLGIDTRDFCGGSLISERAVLSAAHCYPESIDIKKIRVYLGLHDRGLFENQKPWVQVFTVDNIRLHSGFESHHFNADVAILILDKPADIGKYVRPVCLPRSDLARKLPHDSTKRGVVIGWGVIDIDTGEVAFVLQKTRLPLIKHQRCVKKFRKKKPVSFKDIFITSSMICAGYIEGGKDSCNGDSGGPFMYRHPTRNMWFVNGIVSFGSTARCGDKTFGIYVNTSSYIEWIDKRINP